MCVSAFVWVTVFILVVLVLAVAVLAVVAVVTVAVVLGVVEGTLSTETA